MLTASRLTRAFGARVAVEDVSFALARGEILGLLGPNGGGKTTTLRMLAGLIAPSSGQVIVGGAPVSAATAVTLRRRIGFLTEVPGLWDQFTVQQNLLVHARLQGLEAPDRAVHRTMDLFGVADRAAERTSKLSKGLKQRVALARTLLHDPDIVLLDEPTAGLDPESARTVRDLILRLRAEGRTVVVSTHNLDEVDRVADRVVVIRRRVLANDAPAALRRQLFGMRIKIVLSAPAAPFARLVPGRGVVVDDHVLFVDQAQAAIAVPELVRRLVAAGAGIEAVVPDAPSLEDAYLALVHASPSAPGGEAPS